VSLPIVGKQNPAEAGMPLETNAEEIEDLALHPVGSGPDGGEGIGGGVAAGETHAQAKLFAAWDGGQLVIELKARLEGKAVNAGEVGKEVEVEAGIFAEALGGGAEEFSGDDDGDFPTKLGKRFDGARIPTAQPFDYNSSFLLNSLRHGFNPKGGRPD
jgi:hypothetical protein